MGFFKDLWDARPSKSHERADELHQAGIVSVSIPNPEMGLLYKYIYDCGICKFRFSKINPDFTFKTGSLLQKQLEEGVTVPVIVKVNNEPSFNHTDYDGEKTTVVVCHKCLVHFRFDEGLTEKFSHVFKHFM